KIVAYIRLPLNVKEVFDKQLYEVSSAIQKKPDWVITKVFTEEIGGLNTNISPVLENCLKYCQTHQISVIAIRDRTRISRFIPTYKTVINSFKEQGIKFWSCIDKEFLN
ncbi:MAG TPA: recombinase family protein, partial [Ruminococcus flavefaciens]|nr:recombinase family protein [Ruminococcus flavefaciens]